MVQFVDFVISPDEQQTELAPYYSGSMKFQSQDYYETTLSKLTMDGITWKINQLFPVNQFRFFWGDPKVEVAIHVD